MNVAMVGCGYVADSYAATLRSHPELNLVGAFDINDKHLNGFCQRWPARPFSSLQELLDNPAVELVLNLTNPRSHFEVTRRSLEAGKHVYSEKPLGMHSEQARQLVSIAEQNQRYLAAAPCSLLSETAQTMWKALQEGAVGKVRLVYANFDDGMIAPQMSPWTWLNSYGAAWPAKDEFEVGCTYEHAGYVLTWLAAFFGPAKSVTAFASCLLPEKGVSVDSMAPDFTMGCIKYANGIVARVTCGLVAPWDKSMTIVGDEGVIITNSVRDDSGPVYVRRLPSSGRFARAERWLNSIRTGLESRLPWIAWSGSDWKFQRKYPFARKPSASFASCNKRVDFLRGPSEMVEAIGQKRPCRLSAGLGLHITELIEALQYPEKFGGKRTIESTFEPIQPLPWNG